jgi:peptidoglycan/xylan/chitin deacetylase (PgdA/CDA1 family)
MWSVDSNDWKYKGTGSERQQNINTIVNNVLSNVSDGDIVLMHEIYENSYEAFCIIARELDRQGYEFVTIEELLGDSLQVGKVYTKAKAA